MKYQKILRYLSQKKPHFSFIFNQLGRPFTASFWHVRTLQWIAPVVVGIVLGFYVVGAYLFMPGSALYLMVIVFGPCGLLVIGKPRITFLTMIILDIPFHIDKSLFYDTTFAQYGALGGLDLSVTTMSIASLYALWLSELLTGTKTIPPHFVRNILPPLLFVISVAISIFVARNRWLSFIEIFQYTQALLVFTYIANNVRTREEVLFIYTLLLIGFFFESLIMAFLMATKTYMKIAVFELRVDIDGRVGGTIGGPNSAAAYVSLLLAPASSLLLTQTGKWYKQLGMLSFCVGIIAILSTQSRGSWTASVLSLTLLFACALYRGWVPTSVLVGGVVIMAVIGIFFSNMIIGRLTGDDNGSAESRVPLVHLAYRVIRDYPILGCGTNNLAVLVKRYRTPEVLWLHVVHNQYLLIWSETGIIGLSTYVAFLIATIRRGWNCWQLKDRLLSPLGLASAVAIIGHMTHMNADFFISRPELQLLWVSAALITTMSRMTPHIEYVEDVNLVRPICPLPQMSSGIPRKFM